MKRRMNVIRGVATAITLVSLASFGAGQIPGQFAQDFVAGRVPDPAEIAKTEADVAAHPDDLRLTRKLGKAYFFEYFGEGKTSSATKAEKMFKRSLEIAADDPESVAYLGALAALESMRSKEPAVRKAKGEEGLELLKKAQQLGPNNGAVLAVTGGSFMFLADQFGTAPLAAATMEKIRTIMGPAFARFSHHGQQRILLTQGQAYAKMGEVDKARGCFEEGLKVDEDSVEAVMIKAEIAKLGQ
ncbi:MAG TPA: tetratricopeptide repeat protein [Blastocatellia bacterium]|nr:tetratricopeptide repeat protein [Blastocatellia bacterium]